MRLLIHAICTLALLITSVVYTGAQTNLIQPVDYVKVVADRVIAHAALKLKAIVKKPSQAFQSVETIDFGRSFNVYNGVSYAYTIVNSSAETTMNFQLLHEDQLKVWVNDDVVYDHNATGKVELLENERDWKMPFTFNCHLKKGNNVFWIKSSSNQQKTWKVMLQPLIPLPEEGDITKHEIPLKFSLSANPLISEDVEKISNWLVIGPFATNDNTFDSKRELVIGKLYKSGERPITWEVPKVELATDVFEADPLWGSLYDWNYHTAGLAWAIGHLGEFTKEEKYKKYMTDYCDFMFGIKPYMEYEKYTRNTLRSRFSRMLNSQLLDFKVAPVLPFAYRLQIDKKFDDRALYESLIAETKNYLATRQLKLADGTLARETPKVYTVWVDDMFMGIPFMLQASTLAKTEKEKDKLITEAAELILKFNKKLFDSEKNLYHHAWFSEKPNVGLPYWSRANGWGIWAASEVLLYLPAKHPLRKSVLSIYKNHIDGIVKYQNEATGFYPNLLDDPSSFKETSGTAIFTMAIARGINVGWLERKKYEHYAVKGWDALRSIISPTGEVTDICMGTMCSEDKDYYRTRPVVHNDSHGLLGLMIAGIEMQKLIGDKQK